VQSAAHTAFLVQAGEVVTFNKKPSFNRIRQNIPRLLCNGLRQPCFPPPSPGQR
jgi:hypothetical protein